MRVNAVVHEKCGRCHKQSELKANTPVCKMADHGRLTVAQKMKVVLFYAETKSVVATQRHFCAHFDTRWASCKQTIYRLCQQFETNGCVLEKKRPHPHQYPYTCKHRSGLRGFDTKSQPINKEGFC